MLKHNAHWWLCPIALTTLVLTIWGCSKDAAPVAPTIATYNVAMLYDKTDRADTTSGYSITYSTTATIAWGTDSLQLENHVPQTAAFPIGTVLSSRYSAHVINPASPVSHDTVIVYFSSLTLQSNAVWRF